MSEAAEAKPAKGQLALAEKFKNKSSERYLHKTSGNKPLKKTVKSVHKGEEASEAVVSGESDSSLNNIVCSSWDFSSRHAGQLQLR